MNLGCVLLILMTCVGIVLADQPANPTSASPGPAGNISATPSQPGSKISAGPASLMSSPNPLTFSLLRGKSSARKITLRSGGGLSVVSWEIGELVTAEGLALPDSAITLNSSKGESISVESGRPTMLPVQINLGDAHSGEYTGDISFYSTNTSSTVQVIVRVKDGPLWPGIVLFVGSVLSLMLSRYREAGRPYDVLVLQASKLAKMLAVDSDFFTAIEFKDAIANKLNVIRNQLDEGRYADATTEMASAMKMMDNWLVYKPTWLQLFSKLNSLRHQATASQDPDVQSRLTQALQAAADAADVGTPNALSTAIQALAAACRPVGGAQQLATGKQPFFTSREVQWAYIRTKLYLLVSYTVMILLFCLVGYSSLYDTKPVFGANPLMDYSALVLWGFGVETATRTSLSSVAKSWGIPGFS